MEQQCPNCGSNYDYYDRKATIICQNNHVICDMCVISLKKVSGNCPYCNSVMISSMSQGDQSLYMGQPLEYSPITQPVTRPRVQNRPRPPQSQPQPQYIQPQPQVQIQVQPQLVQNVNGDPKKRGAYCVASIFCLFAFILLLVETLLENDNNINPSVDMIFGLIVTFLFFLIFFLLCIGGGRRQLYGYNRL